MCRFVLDVIFHVFSVVASDAMIMLGYAMLSLQNIQVLLFTQKSEQ